MQALAPAGRRSPGTCTKHGRARTWTARRPFPRTHSLPCCTTPSALSPLLLARPGRPRPSLRGAAGVRRGVRLSPCAPRGSAGPALASSYAAAAARPRTENTRLLFARVCRASAATIGICSGVRPPLKSVKLAAACPSAPTGAVPIYLICPGRRCRGASNRRRRPPLDAAPATPRRQRWLAKPRPRAPRACVIACIRCVVVWTVALAGMAAGLEMVCSR